MIEVSDVSKSFDGFKALCNVNLHVNQGSIYGLVGVNGSGKTTIINHLTGVFRQDSGTVKIDGQKVYDNESIKRRIGYIPDDLYFFGNYSISSYERFYKKLHTRWNGERFQEMVSSFGLDQRRRLSRFSKGMQKQAAFVFAMSSMPDVMILDEPIDGLDPIVRRLVMQRIVEDVSERGMTVLVSSHNLKEMEGICDSIGIMQKGKLAIERDLDDLKSDVHKVQAAYSSEIPNGIDKYQASQHGFEILHSEVRGSVEILVVRGKEDLVRSRIMSFKPYVYDLLPLTLEEIFIYEMGGAYNEFPI